MEKAVERGSWPGWPPPPDSRPEASGCGKRATSVGASRPFGTPGTRNQNPVTQFVPRVNSRHPTPLHLSVSSAMMVLLNGMVGLRPVPLGVAQRASLNPARLVPTCRDGGGAQPKGSRRVILPVHSSVIASAAWQSRPPWPRHQAIEGCACSRILYRAVVPEQGTPFPRGR